jgi:hypothetical protein
MSNSHGTLHKPDAEFLAQANNISEQCRAHAPEWNIFPAQVDEFEMRVHDANIAYENNNKVATKNATTSVQKKAAFGELKHLEGIFINALEGNTRVPDTALELMGLRPRQPHGHHPLPRPTDPLVLSIRKQHDEITVYAARPEHDQPTAGVGPTHYHGFALRIRHDGEDTCQTVISTRLHHTLFFERADEGKRIFLSAAWVNPRLEPGPWCEELPEIIG